MLQNKPVVQSTGNGGSADNADNAESAESAGSADNAESGERCAFKGAVRMSRVFFRSFRAVHA
jgi:hypothetical protein